MSCTTFFTTEFEYISSSSRTYVTDIVVSVALCNRSSWIIMMWLIVIDESLKMKSISDARVVHAI